MIEILNYLYVNDNLLDDNFNNINDYIYQYNIKNVILLSNKYNKLCINTIHYNIQFDNNTDIYLLNNYMYKHIDDIIYILHNYLIKHKNTLLLCHNHHDLDAVLIAYLIKYGKLNIYNAKKLIKTKKTLDTNYYEEMLYKFYKNFI